MLILGTLVVASAYQEIATACGLAMTLVVAGWSFYFSWSVIKHGRDVEDAVPYKFYRRFSRCRSASAGDREGRPYAMF